MVGVAREGHGRGNVQTKQHAACYRKEATLRSRQSGSQLAAGGAPEHPQGSGVPGRSCNLSAQPWVGPLGSDGVDAAQLVGHVAFQEGKEGLRGWGG